ncbi:MAG TPA: DUF4157 domain-containing protein [Humisphaera sp.]|nr:DUF4157 domain-containing protein [Humisphaera sp.]
MQRKCACGATPGVDGECEQCRGDRLSRRRATTGGYDPSSIPPIVHNVLRSPGKPLDPATRTFMEPRFGFDFGNVRIRADEEAAASARAINALAYTVGSHITFGHGQYAPTTSTGIRLMAHELAHVVQQGARQRTISGGPLRMESSGEADADRAAEKIAAGQFVGRMHMEPSGGVRRFAGELPNIGELEIPELEVEPELELEPEVEVDPEFSPEAELEPDVEMDAEPEIEAEPDLEPDVSADPEPAPVPPVPDPGKDKEKDKDACGSKRLPTTFVTFTPGPLGQAGTVLASPLTRCPGNTRGSQAKESVYQPQFDCIRKAGKRRIWYPLHLLHGWTRRTGSRNLHGPGNDRKNIIIGSGKVNSSMYQRVEKAVLDRVYGLKQALWYQAKVADYFPGNEFFAKGISVEYGEYDVNTSVRGPALDSISFPTYDTPPLCPPASSAGAIAAAPKPDFKSTVSICLKSLNSRPFQVNDGGVVVKIQAHWLPGASGATGNPCRPAEYTVTLQRPGIIYGWNNVSSKTVPAGHGASLTWKQLQKDNYRVEISAPTHTAGCCLTGDISVRTFSAPRLKRGEAIA